MTTPIGDALAKRMSAMESDYSAEGASETPSTLTRIRHRRTGFVAGTFTAALVGIGLIASLGVTLARDADPVDEPEGSLQVSFLPGHLNLPTTTAQPTWYCGDPPPLPFPTGPGFSLTTDQTPLVLDYASSTFSDGGYLQWPEQDPSATLSIEDSGAGAIIGGWVYVRNGTVVGYHDQLLLGAAGIPVHGLRSWETGDNLSFGLESSEIYGHTLGMRCDFFGGASYQDGEFPLPAGEYLAVPLVRIVSTPETDAAFYLAELGAAPYIFTDLSTGTSTPYPDAGSWDCQQAKQVNGLLPVACLEPSVIDPETGRATIEIPADRRNPERDILLVGQPIPLTVVGSPPSHHPSDPLSAQPTEQAFTVCEDSGRDTQATTGFTVFSYPRDLVFGRMTSAPSTILGQPSSDGTLRLPGELELTVYRVSMNTLDALEVGRGAATVNDGEPFLLNRYSGPTPIDLEITSLSWCGDDHPSPSSYYQIGLVGEAEWMDGEVVVRRELVSVIVE